MSYSVLRNMFFRNLTLKNNLVFPKLSSTQAVGKPQHLKYEGIKKCVQETVLPSVLLNPAPKTIEDWKDARNKLLGAANIITPTSIDTMVLNFLMGVKRFDLGCEYIDYLKKSQVKLNLSTTGKYLKLLYIMNQNEVIDGELANEVVSIYEDLSKTYKVLDEITTDSAILALSLTDQWKTCIKLLDDIKKTGNPTVSSYTAIMAAAFRNSKNEFAWKIAQELIEQDKVPLNPAYFAYLNKVKQKRKLTVEAMEILLNFLHVHDLACSKEVAEKIYEVAGHKGWKATFTAVDNRGVCQNCKEKLQRVELSAEEFASLKKAIIENVIVGKDIFQRTTPKELDQFKKFVANMPQYDVVIDGLNVAYAIGTRQSALVFSSLVRFVVQYFVEQNKKVLVLGRTHMNSFPKQHWSYVINHADTFLTEGLSQDDPYLLYCALNSGVNTIIVSRDLMRSHIFKLKDPRKKILFNRWLTQCQYQLQHVTTQGKTFFRRPQPYMRTAQKCGHSWHIPYIDSTLPDVNNKWLCLEM